jgi:hypothetical protein
MRVLLAVWLWALAVTISPAAPAPPQAGPGPAAMPLDVLSYDLAANQDTPELCFHLSQTVMRQPGMPLESFVAAEPAVKLIARPRNTALCVTGFDFGVTYAVTLKAGLPGVAGALAKDTQIHVQVPHRPPELGFAAPDADLLPRLGSEGLPVRSVNTPAISIAIFRISDRDMLLQPRATLTGDLAAAFAPTRGERIWQGTVETKGEPDKDAVTYLQPDKVLGPLKPGVYVAVAWPSGFPAIPGPRPLPTQYFTVCDFGLTAYRAAANMLVAVRSLSTAAAVSGIDVALVAVDNRELARVRTDESGFARFDGALLSGRGDDRPAALYAYGGAGELSALPIAAISGPIAGSIGRATPSRWRPSRVTSAAWRSASSLSSSTSIGRTARCSIRSLSRIAAPAVTRRVSSCRGLPRSDGGGWRCAGIRTSTPRCNSMCSHLGSSIWWRPSTPTPP